MRPRVVDGVIVSIVAVGLLASPFFLQRHSPALNDGPGPVGTDDPGPATPSSVDERTSSFDGTTIAFSVHRPAHSSRDHPVPLILAVHGVTDNRSQAKTLGYLDAFLTAGFGVLTPDLRGHGESGGTSRLSDPDQDVRDLSAILDWAYDHLDWIVKQDETGFGKDLLVGGWGLSLGGAMIQNSASTDRRLDALAPQNTMNDYVAIVAPNGAVKSLFVNAFIVAGRNPRPDDRLGTWRADPQFEQLYAELMTTNRLPEAGARLFEHIGPYTYLDRITVPVLYIQGLPDMAFPLNEALRSHAVIRRSGAETHVSTWLGGHHVPFQAPEGGSPCGDKAALLVEWFDHTLRGGTFDHPEFEIAMDDGTCLRLSSLPTARPATDLGPIAMPENAGSLLVPILTVATDVALVGPPIFNVTRATVAGIDDILYASLVVVTSGGTLRVIDDQVAPLRLAGPQSNSVRLEMNAVAANLHAGDRLFLKLDRVNEWFQTNTGRTPGAILIEGARIELPFVS